MHRRGWLSTALGSIARAPAPRPGRRPPRRTRSAGRSRSLAGFCAADRPRSPRTRGPPSFAAIHPSAASMWQPWRARCRQIFGAREKLILVYRRDKKETQAVAKCAFSDIAGAGSSVSAAKTLHLDDASPEVRKVAERERASGRGAVASDADVKRLCGLRRVVDGIDYRRGPLRRHRVEHLRVPPSADRQPRARVRELLLDRRSNRPTSRSRHRCHRGVKTSSKDASSPSFPDSRRPCDRLAHGDRDLRVVRGLQRRRRTQTEAALDGIPRASRSTATNSTTTVAGRISLPGQAQRAPATRRPRSRGPLRSGSYKLARGGEATAALARLAINAVARRMSRTDRLHALEHRERAIVASSLSSSVVACVASVTASSCIFEGMPRALGGRRRRRRQAFFARP